MSTSLDLGGLLKYDLCSSKISTDSQLMNTSQASTAQKLLSYTQFSETRWTVIGRAQEGSASQVEEAMESLCSIYWYPAYAYVRRRGFGSEDAEDITQAFLAKMVTREVFQMADPTKGKFRAFLLHNLKFFISNWRDFQNAEKRGGGEQPISIDAEKAEGRYKYEPIDDTTPDQIFDRQWALTLLEHVLSDLRSYYQTKLGKEDLFESLKATVYGAKTSDSYAKIAAQFGVTENTIKTEVKRLRERYVRRLEAAIADTVGTEEEMDDEKQFLMNLFV